MNSSELWTENTVLRQKVFELQKLLEQEQEERLKLKAENLWIKRLLQQDLGQQASDISKKRVV